jgi:hypothetical protein
LSVSLSFTEVTDLNNNGAAASSSAGIGNARNIWPVRLSSKVIGLDIYSNSTQDIGQIKAIAINHNGRSQAYIVSVGGVLGMGEQYVAVSAPAVKVSYNGSDKKWHASMNASADQLKAAPEFNYAGRWDASRT